MDFTVRFQFDLYVRTKSGCVPPISCDPFRVICCPYLEKENVLLIFSSVLRYLLYLNLNIPSANKHCHGLWECIFLSLCSLCFNVKATELGISRVFPAPVFCVSVPLHVSFISCQAFSNQPMQPHSYSTGHFATIVNFSQELETQGNKATH